MHYHPINLPPKYSSKPPSISYHQSTSKGSKLQKQNQMNENNKERNTVGSYTNNENLRNSIHDLMKQMESALKSPQIPKQENFYLKQSQLSKKIQQDNQVINNYNNNQTQNQNQVQQSSGLGMKKIKTLPELQISIVQQILMLRQQKIILLEQRNHIIDRKNQLEREIARLRKKKYNHQQKEQFVTNASFKNSPSHSSNASLKDSSESLKQVDLKRLQELQSKNNQLKDQIHKLLMENQNNIPQNCSLDLIRLQDTKTMLEIQKYSRLSSRIQQQINQISNGDINRFQTFLPTQKRIHLDNLSSQSSVSNDNLIWNNETLNILTTETQKLINQANELINLKKQSSTSLSLPVLEIITELNESIKVGYVERVRRQKQLIPLIKQHQQHLRALINK